MVLCRAHMLSCRAGPVVLVHSRIFAQQVAVYITLQHSLACSAPEPLTLTWLRPPLPPPPPPRHLTPPPQVPEHHLRMVTEMLESYEREIHSIEGSLREAEENLENTRWVGP